MHIYKTDLLMHISYCCLILTKPDEQLQKRIYLHQSKHTYDLTFLRNKLDDSQIVSVSTQFTQFYLEAHISY